MVQHLSIVSSYKGATLVGTCKHTHLNIFDRVPTRVAPLYELILTVGPYYPPLNTWVSKDALPINQ